MRLHQNSSVGVIQGGRMVLERFTNNFVENITTKGYIFRLRNQKRHETKGGSFRSTTNKKYRKSYKSYSLEQSVCVCFSLFIHAHLIAAGFRIDSTNEYLV